MIAPMNELSHKLKQTLLSKTRKGMKRAVPFISVISTNTKKESGPKPALSTIPLGNGLERNGENQTSRLGIVGRRTRIDGVQLEVETKVHTGTKAVTATDLPGLIAHIGRDV